jgi:integrase
MRAAGDGTNGERLRGLIVVLWRSGLRVSEALALAESDLDRNRGRYSRQRRDPTALVLALTIPTVMQQLCRPHPDRPFEHARPTHSLLPHASAAICGAVSGGQLMLLPSRRARRASS